MSQSIWSGQNYRMKILPVHDQPVQKTFFSLQKLNFLSQNSENLKISLKTDCRSKVLINTIKISYHTCFYHNQKSSCINFRDLGWANQAAAPARLEADDASSFIRIDTPTLGVSYVYSRKLQPSLWFKILTGVRRPVSGYRTIILNGIVTLCLSFTLKFMIVRALEGQSLTVRLRQPA